MGPIAMRCWSSISPILIGLKRGESAMLRLIVLEAIGARGGPGNKEGSFVRTEFQPSAGGDRSPIFRVAKQPKDDCL